MDYQRILLGGSLAVVTYLLILQWSDDYSQPTTSQPVAAVSAPAVSTPSTDSLPSAPSITATTSAAPSAEAIPGNQSASVDTTNRAVITTDTLRLTVDLQGGDIVRSELLEYPEILERPDIPFVLLDDQARTYTAMSGLVGPNGLDNQGKRPTYQVAGPVTMVDGQSLVVPLVFENDQVKVTKRFTLQPGQHSVTVEHQVENKTSDALVMSPFHQLKRDDSGDPSTQTSMGVQAFLGFALRTSEERYQKVDLDDLNDPTEIATVNAELQSTSVPGAYLALVQHYFVSAWVPQSDLDAAYSFRGLANGHNVGSIVGAQTSIGPGQTATFSAQLYTGPKHQDTLENLSDGLNLTVDYGWLWFISQPLFMVMDFLHSYIGNWGLAIIGVTLLVKLAFFKLSAAAYASMARMRKFTPEMTRLRELYGDDKQRLSKEMMDLYKKEKINPLGGCLPILVQMPVFLALYWVLLESVELRQAPFFLWITDLSVKDPYFVLPLLMGASMFVQQMLNPTPPDPMQAKIMKIMPVAFTFFFLWFPAGLVLYWVSNNVLSIAQQYVITKRIESGDSETA